MLSETRPSICAIVGCLVVSGLLHGTASAELRKQTYTYKQAQGLEIKLDVHLDYRRRARSRRRRSQEYQCRL